MGVMGAALATILSQIISAVLVMGSLMRTRDIYRLHLRKISIDWIMLKRIIRIGFPAGVQSILYSVSNVIIQSAVNSLGTNNVAAWAAYGNTPTALMVGIGKAAQKQILIKDAMEIPLFGNRNFIGGD